MCVHKATKKSGINFGINKNWTKIIKVKREFNKGETFSLKGGITGEIKFIETISGIFWGKFTSRM